MSTSSVFGSAEIVQIAEAVAREKGISRDELMNAMEKAIQVAARKKYGHDQNIKAEIDKKTGEVKLYRERAVVEEVTNPVVEISLADASAREKGIEIGGIIRDPLPPIDIGRVAAQTAKQVIVQEVKDAERAKQYEEFKDKVNTIVNGVVKRVEYGNVAVDLGKTEAALQREDLIPRESFRPGDRIRAFMCEARRERKGPQLFLSRVHPGFVSALFAQEVPEIYDGIIEIKAVARDPGSRAKIAVVSHDSNIDPVASCVGVRGVRVQAVVNELQGEKIDIIPWSPDIASFVVNALTPAEVTKVVVDEDSNKIEVVVPDEQQNLAIGRRGQNVKLASQLTGWYIEILTEEEESRRRTEEFNKLTEVFVGSLNVEEVIAHLLVTEGFSSVEEVAFVPLEDLANIEGFDQEVAGELHNRAVEFLEKQRKELDEKMSSLKIAEDMKTLPGKDGREITPELLVKLGEAGIKDRDALGDLSYDEFVELIPDSGMTRDEINNLIMAARSHWFKETA